MSGVGNLFISSRNLGAAPQAPEAPIPKLASERSSRFFYWFAFFMLSLIVAGSSIEATDRVQTDRRGILNQTWAVICAILSFTVTLGVIVMHISPALSVLIINTKIEGIIIIVMIALWSSLVAVISDSSSGLAVDGEGSVVFGNLYYSSWGGFCCAILLLLNFLREVYFVEVSTEIELRSDRLNLWISCLVVSIILTSSAACVFDHECISTDRYGTKFCNRSLLALVDGATGAAVSIILIGMKLSTGMAPWGIELLLSVLLFLVNCFSMGLVTAEEGPGAKIGNLFYFSWMSLILPFMLMSSTFEYISKLKEEQAVDLYETGPIISAPHVDPFQPTKTVGDFYSSNQSVAPTVHTEAASQYGDATSQYGDTGTNAAGHDARESPDRQSLYSQSGGQSVYSQGGQSIYSKGGGQSFYSKGQMPDKQSSFYSKGNESGRQSFYSKGNESGRQSFYSKGNESGRQSFYSKGNPSDQQSFYSKGNASDRKSFYSQGAGTMASEYASQYGDGQSVYDDGLSVASNLKKGSGFYGERKSFYDSRSVMSGEDEQSVMSNLGKPKGGGGGYYGAKRGEYSAASGMDAGYSYNSGMDAGSFRKPNPKGMSDDSSYASNDPTNFKKPGTFA